MSHSWSRRVSGRLRTLGFGLAGQRRGRRRRGRVGRFCVSGTDRRKTRRRRGGGATRQKKHGQYGTCGPGLHEFSPFEKRRGMDSAAIALFRRWAGIGSLAPRRQRGLGRGSDPEDERRGRRWRMAEEALRDRGKELVRTRHDRVAHPNSAHHAHPDGFDPRRGRLIVLRRHACAGTGFRFRPQAGLGRPAVGSARIGLAHLGARARQHARA